MPPEQTSSDPSGYPRVDSRFKLTVAFDLGGFPLRQRHLVSERFHTFDQVTSESGRIEGVKIVASQFSALQIFDFQDVVEYNEQWVGHRHDCAFFPAAACQPTILRRDVRVR